MRNVSIRLVLLIVAACVVQGSALAQKKKNYTWSDELELLKRVDKLPEYRTDEYVEQVSSYDRTGGNDDGFSGKYSYLRKEGNDLVIADFKGPGVINRIWTPTPTNDMVSFFFDGEKKPRLSIRFSDLFSGKVYPFLKPVCGNEVGGFYCYIPFPYKKSLKIVFHGSKLEFIQIQSRSLPNSNVESYTGFFSEEESKLLTEVCDIWAENIPKVENYTEGLSSDVQKMEKSFTIIPGETIDFFQKSAPGRIVGLEIDGGNSFEGTYKDIILSANWDNEIVDAIYAPVADFFGYAFGKAAMRSIILGKNSRSNYCYFPMPFDQSAVMKLIYKKRDNVRQDPVTVNIRVYYNEKKRDIAREGKFYTLWKREKTPVGEFYTFLKAEGKGHYVGTIHMAQGLRPGMTLFFEGDDSTHVDGKMRMHGTGSEDYYNGGWYALLDRWDRGVSMPIHGSLDYSLPMNRTGAYRIFLSDKLTWEKEMYHGMEHGEVANNFPVDYASVAFYYGAQPLQSRMEPTEKLREVYYPDVHVYFPQLMQVTPDRGIQIILDRGLMMTAYGQGTARIMLTDVPEGNYKVLINYHERPNGADFQVWQRQKQLSDWLSAKGTKEVEKHRVHVGDIQLTQQTNSVTFHVRKNGNADLFELNLITLEKIK